MRDLKMWSDPGWDEVRKHAAHFDSKQRLEAVRIAGKAIVRREMIRTVAVVIACATAAGLTWWFVR